MWERITQAKRRIQEKDILQQKESDRQNDAEQNSKRQKQESLRVKNSEGIRLIKQAMDNPDLSSVLFELQKRLYRAGLPRSREMLKIYPNALDTSGFLEGTIIHPISFRKELNGIRFIFNTSTNEGLRISTEYHRDVNDVGSGGYESLADLQRFNSVEELISSLVEGIANFELGKSDFDISNFFLLTRKRE